MKQLVILSGKGGTGKTTLAAAFAHLAYVDSNSHGAVIADADVDAANLEMVLHSQSLEKHDFMGGPIAIIDPERCQECGICSQVCRFDAVQPKTNGYSIDPIACDGCAACAHQCPEGAIRMEPQMVGRWYCSESCYGQLFHADLYPAQENSGKLVTLVKQNASLYAMDNKIPLIIVDGPPGIGCPVIASAAGADLAVIVTEPTISGAHDLKRISQTTRYFHIPTLIVINKADLYSPGVTAIENVCKEMGMENIGYIPFDPAVTEAMIIAEPVTVYRPQAPISQAIRHIWSEVIFHLFAEPS
jgi:MinD superfamily P-loop ATPase